MADKPPFNQALDSIRGMAVQLPSLKKIGEDLWISPKNGVNGVREMEVAAVEPHPAEPEAETSPNVA